MYIVSFNHSVKAPWIITVSLPLLSWLSSLVTSILLLNFGSGLMLFSLELICSELSPELVEFFMVLVDVVLSIEDNNVFLVRFSGLEGPVE